MAVATKIFSFAIGSEGWSYHPALSNTTGGYDATSNATGDTPATGALRISAPVAAIERAASDYFQWSGTYGDLGVPAGVKVAAVRGTYAYRCLSYTDGSLSSLVGVLRLIEGATGTEAALTSTVNYAAPTAWLTNGPLPDVPLPAAPNTQGVTLRLGSLVRTLGGAGAVEVCFDRIVVEVVYTRRNRSQVIMI